MITTLIGMSGVGKTYHGKKLAKKLGVPFFDIDILIQNQLGLIGEFANIDKLADWLGFPWDKEYKEKANWYILAEQKEIEQILESNSEAVLSTTGSVIYCDCPTLDKLKNKTIIIHLACDLPHIEDMKTEFRNTPKPIIWRDVGQVTELNIFQKYENLLQKRLSKYQALEHQKIDYSVHKAMDFEL
jgi:shikimate kinase